MRRPAEPVVLGAIAALCIALVVAAIVTVGGPETARSERRDQQRLDDLLALQTYVACIAEQSPDGLPQSLSALHAECAAPLAMNDRITVVPYVYDRLSPSEYRLCAAFEQSGEMPTSWRIQSEPALTFDPATGCITGRVGVAATAP